MKDYRPGYHYRPEKNWINDPCGTTQYKGTYHLYHQYNPNGDMWGDMHWAHATSLDLIDWKEQPIALKPDYEGGEDHIFTGGAARLPDGSPVFYYTSISNSREPEQRIAFPTDETLNTLVQTTENAMLLDMHPEGMKITEWRDPGVFVRNGQYIMTLGCRLDDHGAALLYTSDDGIHYKYHSVLMEAGGGEDYSWECPNFFPLGDKHVFIYSPYRQPLYVIGTLTDDLRFIPEANGVLDESGQEGHYAPQVFRDEKGRTILMDWMPERSRGKWDGSKGWAGCIGMPKELYIEDNILKMRVIPEAEKLVTSVEEGCLPLSRVEAGLQYRLTVDAQLDHDGCVSVSLLATEDGQEETLVSVYGTGRMVIDRMRSSTHPTRRTVQERRVDVKNGSVHLEIYVDHSAVEASANGEWISTRVYPAGDDCTGLTVNITNGEGKWNVAQLRSCEK